MNAYYGIKRRGDRLRNGLVAALSVHVDSCPVGNGQEVWNKNSKKQRQFHAKGGTARLQFRAGGTARYLRQHPDTAERLRTVING